MNSKADTNIYLLIIVLLAVLVCYLQPKLIIPALIILVLSTIQSPEPYQQGNLFQQLSG